MGFGDVEIKSNSKFLKVEAGQPCDVRILSESPIESFKHSGQPGPRPVVECRGEDVCSLCQAGDDAQQKFAVNVFDHGSKKVLVWEYGVGVAKQIRAIANVLTEDKKTVNDVDLRVEATGSGLQKRYTVTPRLTSKPVPGGLVLHKIAEDVPF